MDYRGPQALLARMGAQVYKGHLVYLDRGVYLETLQSVNLVTMEHQVPTGLGDHPAWLVRLETPHNLDLSIHDGGEPHVLEMLY